GKLFYSEEDTRLHRALQCPDCVSGDASTSRQILLRDFFSAWRTGASCWWMDLAGKGWYREKSFQAVFRECRAIAEETQQCHRTPAQIAVFVSEASMRYNRCAPTSLHGPLVGQNLNEIAAVGAPYDLFRLEDLPRLRESNSLASYRLCVFLNAIDVSDSLRQEIGLSLKRDGRTLLWYYLPGAIRHRRYDMDAARLLTGLRMRLLQEDQLASLLTESWLNGRRISYGHPRNVLPRMTCVDPDAEALGWYCEGGGACHPEVGTGVSFARRHFAEWSSVWSSSPLLPSLWLQNFAREAGVHLYSERGDLVFPVGDYLGVSSKIAGVIPLRLPRASDVWDAETGECLAKNTTALDLSVARGEWRLLRIGITDCPF
ncbi:MAG: hypothetical protein J5833_03175, partial [Victivallales bacterium]|nr:hypothetical protein [Victivallales bacterium]